MWRILVRWLRFNLKGCGMIWRQLCMRQLIRKSNQVVASIQLSWTKDWVTWKRSWWKKLILMTICSQLNLNNVPLCPNLIYALEEPVVARCNQFFIVADVGVFQSCFYHRRLITSMDGAYGVKGWLLCPKMLHTVLSPFNFSRESSVLPRLWSLIF